MEQMKNLKLATGIYNTNKMTEKLSSKSKNMVNNMGYILDEEIEKTLGFDSFFSFWKKQFEIVSARLSENQ